MNDSLHSGLLSSAFKSPIVKPLLKKTSLNPEIWKKNKNNYRPVSNLSFPFKILDKVVLRHLSDHLLANNLLCSYQSAYRASHYSLLKNVNSRLSALDEDNVSLLSSPRVHLHFPRKATCSSARTAEQ